VIVNNVAARQTSALQKPAMEEYNEDNAYAFSVRSLDLDTQHP
jgi:hypothetical protein